MHRKQALHVALYAIIGLTVLQREHGKTVMVTHDPKAVAYASRVLHLDNGSSIVGGPGDRAASGDSRHTKTWLGVHTTTKNLPLAQ